MAVLASSATANVVEWFTDGAQRSADGPIPDQVWITAQHALIAVAIAVVVAVPTASLLAHFRRLEIVSSAIVNIGRVIPTVAIVGVVLIWQIRNGGGLGPTPIITALVFLTLPPIFSNTYTAVRGVAPEVVAASRAMGLTDGEILRRVELPLGGRLILTGIRVATVQAMATEVIGAFFAGDGLGVYIRQGLRNQDLHEVQAGAILVTALATVVDLAIWLASRWILPRTGRRRAALRLDPIPAMPAPLPPV